MEEPLTSHTSISRTRSIHPVISKHTIQRDDPNVVIFLALCGRKFPHNAFHSADGRMELVLAGGTEALSRTPLMVREAAVGWLGRWRETHSPAERMRLLADLDPNWLVPVVGLERGLTDPVVALNMGQTAEVLARDFGSYERWRAEFRRPA